MLGPYVRARLRSWCSLCMGDHELYDLGSALGPGEGVVARAAGGENEAGPVGAAAQRPGDAARPGVAPCVDPPVESERAREPLHAQELPGGCDEEPHARAAAGTGPRRLDLL